MSNSSQFLLQVVSQERQLLAEKVDSLTIPTTSGEVTILANHIPLFSKVAPGILVYRQGNEDHSLVVSTGFLDVASNHTVTVLVDSAVLDREISVAKAEAAIKAASETMSQPRNERELLMAEASLKQAMLELRIAQRTKKAGV